MFGFPSYRLGGTIFGDRTIEANGCQIYNDITNNRKAVLVMSSFKNTGWIMNTFKGCKDEILGIIYVPKKKKKVKTLAEVIKKNYSRDMEQIYSLDEVKDIESEICKCHGSWLGNIDIDGKSYWNVAEDVPDR